MSELSPKVTAIARKNVSKILSALASVGQSTIAKHIGVNESTICRWKPDENNSKDNPVYAVALALALYEDGQKIVPDRWTCESPEVNEAMRVLARKALDDAG